MEYLDIYDEKQNFLGKELRKLVHQNALWHKTIHCWLYDNKGNVYFQIRNEENKFYTTASGHVAAGETLTVAFGREIKEELGINLDYERAEIIQIVKFIMDPENKDRTMFRDRAFAHIYGYCLDTYQHFSFDKNEVLGLVKVNANDALNLFKTGNGKINATIIDDTNNFIERLVDFNEFLVNNGENALDKYGPILNFVISKTTV